MLELGPIPDFIPRKSTRGDPWTDDEARPAVAPVHRSGLSLSAFARRHGVFESQLYWWRARLRSHPNAEPGILPFVDVRTQAQPDRESNRALRQTAGKAAMAALHDWLFEQKPQHLLKSPMGQAISYALGQWSAQQVFLENPAVPIDNNASERAVRIVALGRKNFLFVGNDVAGQNLAVLMSLVRSCDAVGVNPQAYLADVLMRVQDWPAARVEELLPEKWNTAEAGRLPRTRPKVCAAPALSRRPRSRIPT